MGDLKATLGNAKPADGLARPLAALWWAAKGDWDAAHKIVMNEETKDAAWVHAYLHRVEGDLSNAGYWYRRAHKPAANDTLDAEWQRIVDALRFVGAWAPWRDSVSVAIVAVTFAVALLGLVAFWWAAVVAPAPEGSR